MLQRRALLVLSGLILFPASMQGAEDDEAAKSLRLLLIPGALEIVAYEPLMATVAIKNVSSQTVEINVWATCTLQLLYARGDEAFAPYRPGWNAGKSISGRRKLAPGEALTNDETFLLFSGGGGGKFLFAEPGRYRLKAQVFVGRQTLQSEAVGVLVKPLPPDHVAAADLVRAPGAARMLQGWEWREAEAGMLEKLTGDFPGCLYVDHAHYVLGNYYASQHYSTRRGDVRAAERAFLLYSAVSARIGALRARALLRMAALAAEVPKVRSLAKLDELLRELKGYETVAKSIERRGEFEAACEKLEAALAPADTAR